MKTVDVHQICKVTVCTNYITWLFSVPPPPKPCKKY